MVFVGKVNKWFLITTFLSFFLFIIIIFGNKINEEYTISAKKGTITVDVGGVQKILGEEGGCLWEIAWVSSWSTHFFFIFLNGKSVLSVNSCFVAFLML